MANPAVLSIDTVLYSPAEPDGRTFPAGSEWPGDAWSTNRGGEPVGKASTAQAAKDLIAAQDRLDAMSAQMDRQTHSLAQVSAERDEANGKVADLEQRAIAAEKAQGEAQEAATGYMTERDAARADVQRLTEQNAALKTEADKVPGLVSDLEAANQALADANGKVTSLTADLEDATAPKAKS